MHHVKTNKYSLAYPGGALSLYLKFDIILEKKIHIIRVFLNGPGNLRMYIA